MDLDLERFVKGSYNQILSKSARNLDLATMDIEVENVHTPVGVKYIHEFDTTGNVVSIIFNCSFIIIFSMPQFLKNCILLAQTRTLRQIVPLYRLIRDLARTIGSSGIRNVWYMQPVFVVLQDVIIIRN